MAAKQKQDNFVRNALIIGVGGWLFLKNIVPMFLAEKPAQPPAGDTGENDMINPPVYQAEENSLPEHPVYYPPENESTGDNDNNAGKMEIAPKPELGPPLIVPPAPLPIKPPPPAPVPIAKKVAIAATSLKGIFLDMIDELELGDATWYYSLQDMIDTERPIKQRQKHESSCCNFIPVRKRQAQMPMHKIFY